MDFEEILSQWANRHVREKHSGAGARESQDQLGGRDDNWLERYPPDANSISTKGIEHSRSLCGRGRSIWRKRPHQDTLDLHGLRGLEAREELSRFVRSMIRKGLRKGLVIHGKGNHSPDGSVLAPIVREYLEMSKEIGEFGHAARKDGGSGATWFVLRYRSR